MKRSAAQHNPDKRCIALSRHGHRCVMGRDWPSIYCHMHNPEGEYAQQHWKTFDPPVRWDERMDVEMFDA